MLKAILSLSGGLDSATLLGYLISRQYKTIAYSFFYGSKHNIYELKAAGELANHYRINHHIIDISNIFIQTSSSLLQNGQPIPEGHYNDASMLQTVVPGRNHIFAAILAGIAESIKFDTIALAVHSGDHHIYPDCRPEFIECLNMTIQSQTEDRVQLFTPFLNLSKEHIIKDGLSLQVPYSLTRTCYKDQPIACGKCGSCTERLEAFKLNGSADPILYEDEK